MQDFLVFPSIYAQKINLKSKSLNEQFPHLTYLDLVYHCEKTSIMGTVIVRTRYYKIYYFWKIIICYLLRLNTEFSSCIENF